MVRDSVDKSRNGWLSWKAIIKAHFTCKACAGTFTRLVTESLDAKKKENLASGTAGSASATGGVSTDEAAEGLRFF